MPSLRDFGSPVHLATRFFGALSPRPPSPADESWALGWLGPKERALWERMSAPDQRHAVEVARAAVALLGGESAVERPVVAAALLHDVGKIDSALGTFSRVAVTLAAMVAGRQRLASWSELAPGGWVRGWMRRIGSYLCHDRVGAGLLHEAGSAPFTVDWAQQHHMPEQRWTFDPAVGSALKTADGD